MLLYTNSKKKRYPRAHPDGNVLSNHDMVRLMKVANMFKPLVALSVNAAG